MSTQAQIKANRRNARKSTGPKTAEGKAVAAKNSLKHGLFASENVINGENQADFDHFCEELLAELSPVGTIESILAERVVSLAWRLKRAERMQNEVVDAKIRREMNSTFPKLSETLITGKPCDVSKYSKDCYDDLALGYIAMWDFAETRVLERLMMYERRIEHSLYKTMNELQRRQLMRELEETEVKKPSICTPTQGRDALATEAAIQPEEKEGKNEKQSQFAASVDARCSAKEGYENTPSPRFQENEPKQSQCQPQRRPCPPVGREMAPALRASP